MRTSNRAVYLALSAAGRRALLGVAAAFAIIVALPVSATASLATTPTPYMGWNTYYGVGGIYNESTIKSVASSLVSSGLAQAGYKIVWLDWGWSSNTRDASGNLTVDPTQWPDGMAGLTAWLHGQGLQAGIYTDAGSSGCSGQGVGSYGHYQQDANQFAAWGFDAVKVDFCGAGQTWPNPTPGVNDPKTLYTQFSQAVANNASGRPMILNVDNFWTPGQINGTDPSLADSSWDNYQWAPSIAQSWRTDTDIGYGGGKGIPWWAVVRNLSHDTGTSSTPQPGIQSAAGRPEQSGITWGHWNDPDYLGPDIIPPGGTSPSLTRTQAQSQFSMWAMVAAPLILGSDPRALSSTSISMLKNANAIAIDQDSLGTQGYPVTQPGTSAQVWVKPLASGARAVALFNTASSSQQITTSARAVGLPSAPRYHLLNIWTNQTSTTKGKISALVPAYGVVLYRATAG